MSAAPASPVVDLDVWRERARDVRGAEPSAAAIPDERPPVAAAAGASVLRMPAPAGPGPMSVFGPVMAFGLVRRPAVEGALPARLRPVHSPHLEAGAGQDGDGGPDAARQPALAGPPDLRALPALSSEQGVTSAPTPRLRLLLDTRGTPRGPRR
ncbi:hypothetical protein SAMN06264364_11870 [Quadrisphaera granulorum]|uniref:Uncharacterized protein n=1 Tax=Quadrisphaera granulorum TaxID=317664 RepID=A0A316A588_9ACTN|nr:hypothetical protein [Quadrisphaera granulorum]PWJ52699.1 hypothetical protein BXY45_11870 [Quadrisphaera granulorum]SZE97521.1 hypothetical protein SAMN06264364_11870 [Quadrisphaera granulorum]